MTQALPVNVVDSSFLQRKADMNSTTFVFKAVGMFRRAGGAGL